MLHLPSLLSAYAARNVTTALLAAHSVWTAAPSGGSGEFVLDVRVRVPPHQLVLYTWVERRVWSCEDAGLNGEQQVTRAERCVIRLVP